MNKNSFGMGLVYTALTASAITVFSLSYQPNSELRDINGGKFPLFKLVVDPKDAKAENTERIAKNTVTAIKEKMEAKRDSVAKVEQAKKDSIQNAAKAKKAKKGKKHATLLNKNGKEMTAFAANAMKQQQKFAAVNYSRLQAQKLKA